ncbi:MAG: hypothetical protein N2378_09765 [Chloroflexaceae bacterium]|nr:hypothetical protein [Chloroflexaceae bacterium]
MKRIDLLARSEKQPAPASIDVADGAGNAARKDTLAKDATLGNLLVGRLTNIPLPDKPTGDLKLYFDGADLADVWIAVTWT